MRFVRTMIAIGLIEMSHEQYTSWAGYAFRDPRLSLEERAKYLAIPAARL